MMSALTHSQDGLRSLKLLLTAGPEAQATPSWLGRILPPKEIKRKTNYVAAVAVNPVIVGVKKEFDSMGLDSKVQLESDRAILRIEWVENGQTRKDYIDFHDDGKVVWHDFSVKAQPVYPLPLQSGDPAVQLANAIVIDQISAQAPRYLPVACAAAAAKTLRNQLGAKMPLGFAPREALTA